ncbi:RXT2-like protein [Clohesyomyces aquaticus]|uniref:RXT2-like protein n=1 Tax=Clohesyomyces aquaticus TaxID=1231657 RepID=A0A1Y1ZTT0_9PLEO|nr:RXT2-like protein [Clohesyomyces aquaticus]
MAGSQQQQILDTIFSMKRRILKRDDSSDSDEGDTPYNHRMQSLKRKAQYARSGKPESASDPPPYKKRIDHAGYHRYILQRNPPRFDPDGDIVEPGDEYDDEDDLSTVEENPYADIRLEHLLAPLTSAAELPAHPSMSIPYTSKHLTNLTNEAGAISRKEGILLARAKSVFTKLQGDVSWVPSNFLDMKNNEQFRIPESGANRRTNSVVAQKAHDSPLPQEATNADGDVTMEDADRVNGASLENSSTDQPMSNGVHHTTNGETQNGTADQNGQHLNGDQLPSPADDGSDTASQQTAHRMTTRARAHAASPSPPSSPSSVINPVHPLFTFPFDPLPDRDLGLPPLEAEDTRMLLLAFVQKQEEVSRAATDLYMGMLQGERMRQDVLKWSKAEGHIGEMSDGEDWYDREEWMLDQDLVKGKDEEEEEGQLPGKKSTRQRRKPDKEDR